jgi:hypothetical protein
VNLFSVGDEVPPHAKQATGADPDELVAADSLVVLRGAGPEEWAEELQRRRAEIGASYVLVSAEYMTALAPVMERLTGN